jgi:hypothetical protein
MLKRTGIAIGFSLLWMALGASASAQDIPVKQKFVAELQAAVRAGDIDWIADHMRFPVRYFGRENILIHNRLQFVRNQKSFLSRQVREAVLAQNSVQVFQNWQGIMVGTGSHNIWVRNTGEGANERYQIITINDAE